MGNEKNRVRGRKEKNETKRETRREQERETESSLLKKSCCCAQRIVDH